MKQILISILALVVLVGCGPGERPAKTRDMLNPLSPQEIAEVQLVLSDLKPGMEMQEVFTLLRKTPFKNDSDFLSRVGGPKNCRYSIYQLRQGANLVLSFDYTRKSPILVSIQQVGDMWPKNQEEKIYNE